MKLKVIWLNLKKLWNESTGAFKATVLLSLFWITGISLLLFMPCKNKKEIIKPDIVIEKPVVIPPEKPPVIIPPINPPIIEPEIIPEPIKEDPCKKYKDLNNKEFNIYKCENRHIYIKTKTSDILKILDFCDKIKSRIQNQIIYIHFSGKAHVHFVKGKYFWEQYEVK